MRKSLTTLPKQDEKSTLTKFILPTLDDLKLSPIEYDKECKYISRLDDQNDDNIKQNIKDLLLCCAKLRPCMAFYKIQINSHNNTVPLKTKMADEVSITYIKEILPKTSCPKFIL